MAVDPARAKSLFLAASELSSQADRAAYLDRECGGDSELRERVQALLVAHDGPESSQRQSADHFNATVLSGFPDDASAKAVTKPARPATSEQPMTADYRPKMESGAEIANRYRLVEKIGEGGMGEVWVAKQTEPVKRKVALKLIKTGMDSKAVLQRFEQERQALAIMDHPNIARVLDGGMTNTGQPFFVMELVNGLPLNKFCDEAKLGIRERLELFVPICQAVQHAHQKGIIHRDLKPANILVTVIDGRPVPKVIDFGVAKATAEKLTEETMSTGFGAVVGTLEYMSPEQAGFSGEDIDTRADIYSLGVILYEMLTGLRPIDAKRLRKVALLEMIRILKEEDPSKPSTRLSTDESLPSLAAIRQSDPRRLLSLLRGELDWVVMKCLEKQRDRRYETANSLARDIQRYLVDEPVEARPPSASYRLTKFLSRNKGPVLAASIVLLALIGGIAGTTYGLFRAEHQRQAAENSATAERRAKQEALSQRELAERATEKEKDARLDEARQRSIAEDASRQATTEREKAELGLANAIFDRAQSLFDKGDIQTGLLFLARSLRELPPKNTVLADVIRKCIRSYSEEIVEIPVRHFDYTAVPTCATFLPDGQQIAVACEGGSIVIWNLETDEVKKTKMDHSFAINRIAVSLDGTKLITGGLKGKARLWNLLTQEQIGSDIPHTDRVMSVVFSPDSQFVATGGWDQTSRYSSALTGLPVREPITNTHHISDLAISPDGKLLISHDVWMALTVREIETGKILRQLDNPMSISAMSLSHDGRLIGLGTADNVAMKTHDHAFRLLDLETGKQIGEPYHFKDWSTRVSFNADNTRVACGARDNVVRLFDCQTALPVGSELRHRAVIDDLQFAPRGGLLFTLAAGHLRVWRPYACNSETIAKQLENVTHEHEVVYSPDGSRISMFSGDRTLQAYDATRFTPIGAPIQGSKPCKQMAVNYDGTKALLLFEDRKIVQIEIESGRMISPELQLDVEIKNLTLHPAGDLFAACVGTDVAIWSLSTGKEIVDRLPRTGGDIQFSPGGETW